MPLSYKQKYLIFDVESDNLNLAKVRPWQIAWALAEGNKITDTFNMYLDFPNFSIKPEIAKLNHFNKLTYDKNKKPMIDVWNLFKKELFNEDRIVIGQNLIGFDVYAIASLQKYLGEKPDYSYMKRIYDTRPLGKAYKDEVAFPTSGDLLSWQFKIMHDKSSKTKSSQLYQLKNLGIDFDESMLHSAEYDIACTFKIFLELKKRMGF